MIKLQSVVRGTHQRRWGVSTLAVALAVVAGTLAGASAAAQEEQPPEQPLVQNEQLKDGFGHYFKMRAPDSVSHAERLNDAGFVCSNTAVDGVRWVVDWATIETGDGVYDFSALQEVVDTVSNLDDMRDRPCRVLFHIRWNAFANNTNPCPVYLQDQSWPTPHDTFNCGLWQPDVSEAYQDMLAALGAEFDGDVHVQGVVFSETATNRGGGLENQAPNYDAQTYSDLLMSVYEACSTAFPTSWCLPAFNQLPGGFELMGQMAEELAELPNGNICLLANDIHLEARGLYANEDRVYDVLLDFPTCRAAGAEGVAHGHTSDPGAPDDYPDTENTVCAGPTRLSDRACTMDEIFQFAVRGTFGDFDNDLAFDSGLCLNGFITWNYRPRSVPSPTGNTTWDVINVMEENPFGAGWAAQCDGGELPPNVADDDPPECTETITGTREGALRVADGVTCLTEGASVAGPVTIAGGGGLIATGATINGPVTSTAATDIVIADSELAGPVAITDTSHRLELSDTSITGPVALTGNAPTAGPVLVSGNDIDGPLACTGNEPAPLNGGGANSVTGPSTGQCADL